MAHRTSIMASNKLLRSVILLIFLAIIVNPHVWSTAGFTLPELKVDLYFILRLFCFIERIGIDDTILGVFVASIIFFIYNSIIYKNSPVEKLCRDLKDWESLLPAIFYQYLFILIQCAFWGVIFVLGLLFDLLPDGLYKKAITLGSVIAIVNILPICFKMWIKAIYPNKPLAIELTKGIICGFIIGFTLVYIIWYLPYGKELTTYTIVDLWNYIYTNIIRKMIEESPNLILDILKSVFNQVGANNLLDKVVEAVGKGELWKFVKNLFGLPSWLGP